MTTDIALETQRAAERLESNRREVRRVYREIWDEYYAYKPDDTRVLSRDRSAGIVYGSMSNARKALHDHLKREKEKATAKTAELPGNNGPTWTSLPPTLPGVVSSTNHYTRFNLEVDYVRQHYHQFSRHDESAKRRLQTEKGLPRYDWCTWTASCHYEQQEPIMPFFPPEMTGGQLVRYREEFQDVAWTRGYGGPADLHIMIETMRRLMEGGMREIEIDRARVLSKSGPDIESLRLRTDVYQFPRPNEPEWRRLDRDPTADMREDRKELDREGTDADRFWCAVCCTHFCDRHIGEAGYWVHPRPLPQTRQLELAMPTKACSKDCAYYLDPRDLDINPDDPQAPDNLSLSFARFGKDQTVVLKCLLDQPFGPDGQLEVTYCDAAGAMCNTPCRNVILELREWRRFEMQEHKPIIASQADNVISQTISPQRQLERPQRTGKRKVNHINHGVDFESNRYHFCTHEGPCVLGHCLCAAEGANWSCEAACYCPDDCPRRWRGCSCRARNDGTGVCGADCECVMVGRQCDPKSCFSSLYDTQASSISPCENMWTHNVPAHQALSYKIMKKTVVMVSKIPDAGFGLFAAEDLEPGDCLHEYTGEIIAGPEADRRSVYYDIINRKYSFSLDGDALHVDAYRMGNESRYLNWNTPKLANVFASMTKVQGNPSIIIQARRKVKKGEELRIDYGEHSSRFVKGTTTPVKQKRQPVSQVVKRKKLDRSSTTTDDSSTNIRASGTKRTAARSSNPRLGSTE